MPPLHVAQWHFWASWFCLVTGIMVTVLGAIGGLRCAHWSLRCSLLRQVSVACSNSIVESAPRTAPASQTACALHH